MRSFKNLKDLPVVVPEVQPRVVRTPRPQAQKVVAQEGREPVNRQAALIIRPVRQWICQPPPEVPRHDSTRADLADAQAALKAERNTNANLSAEVGRLRERIRVLSAELKSQTGLCSAAAASLAGAFEENRKLNKIIEGLK